MTDHTELRRKAEENLEIEEGHSQMLEFGYVATAHTVIALLDEIDALKAAQAEFRKMLAISYCGYPGLYCDDGELQDSREHPFIDFKRDPVEMIQAKMRERITRRIEAATKEKP